jgi:3-methyladenine DNA glycosylase AlkD
MQNSYDARFIEIKREIEKIKRTKFGISVPELKKLARKIAKNEYKQFLDRNTFETYELKLLHAFVLGYAKDDITLLLEYFERFIVQVDDWAVNDSLCQSFKIARKHQQIVWDYLMQHKNTKKEFESRIISVMLLSHYLNDKYIFKVIRVLDSLNADKYYAQMGIAWALATVMGKYPKLCFEYLKSDDCNLNKSTYNKTIQKIKESFRVSEETKKAVINLKR